MKGRSRKFLMIVAACAAASLVAASLALFSLRSRIENALLARNVDPAIAAYVEAAERNLPFFCEEQRRLAGDRFFRDAPDGEDAGPFLNPGLPWEGAPDLLARLDSPSPADLRVPEPWSERLDEWGSDWLRDGSSAELSGIDFGWMGELRRFSTWDLLNEGPLARIEESEWDRWHIASTPLPDLYSLRIWAKLRLLAGLQQDRMREASAEVRHLAWLSYQNETHSGAAIGHGLLALDREAYDSPHARQVSRVGWKPMSPDQLDRMRRLVRVKSAYDSLALPSDLAARVQDCSVPAVTACLALGDKAGTHAALRRFLQSVYPERFAILEEELAVGSAPCRKALSARYARSSPPLAGQASLQAGRDERVPIPARVFARWFPAVVGKVLLTSDLDPARFEEIRPSVIHKERTAR